MSRFLRVATWSTIFLVALSVLFSLQSTRLASSAEPLYVIDHEIEIDAPVTAVWQVLSDFPSYPEWNPYATRVEGRPVLGETIDLTITQENWSEPLNLRPTIVRVEEDRELAWHGSVFFTGLHETDHYFRLIPLEANRTRLQQIEEFRGWLPEHVQGPAERAYTERAFQAMNETLKRRVEGVE